ncbi:hypothetical protein M0R45_035755 [Rubus argutus]|uniref:Uncharacterized protein n=1 Tax=Rubus argutus TaxID=59490 RepID=A0AAW1VYD6_RUBAR
MQHLDGLNESQQVQPKQLHHFSDSAALCSTRTQSPHPLSHTTTASEKDEVPVREEETQSRISGVDLNFGLSLHESRSETPPLVNLKTDDAGEEGMAVGEDGEKDEGLRRRRYMLWFSRRRFLLGARAGLWKFGD